MLLARVGMILEGYQILWRSHHHITLAHSLYQRFRKAQSVLSFKLEYVLFWNSSPSFSWITFELGFLSLVFVALYFMDSCYFSIGSPVSIWFMCFSSLKVLFLILNFAAVSDFCLELSAVYHYVRSFLKVTVQALRWWDISSADDRLVQRRRFSLYAFHNIFPM